MSYRPFGRSYYGQATVWIKGETGMDVEGAKVYGLWSGSIEVAASGVTDADGKVLIESPSVRKINTVTFTVTNVVKNGRFYNVAMNVETSDSITIP